MGFFSRKKKLDISEQRNGPALLLYDNDNDGETASLLAQGLAKEGANIWFDQFDIEVGANWSDSFDKAFDEAKALIFLVSPSIQLSSYYWGLIGRYTAKYGDDSVILVLIGNPDAYSGLQHVNLDDGIEKTIDVIKTFLANSGIEEVEQVEKEVQSKGYIFISYAEEDSNFVEIIKAFMKKQGYGYWDYRDSERDYHTLLDTELENVIKKAEATLSILSNNWKNSDWSKKEYHFSNEIGKPIFLLRFEDMEPSLATAGIPYIDFSLNQDEGFSKLELEFKRKNL